MSRLRTSVVAALFAACSPVEDTNNQADAPPADTTAPAIVESNPSHMARAFSVIQPLTVVFDDDLDPATVNANTVRLEYDAPEFEPFRLTLDFYKPLGPGMAPDTVVPGTVSYDEVSRTLRFVPKAPLRYGKHHTLVIDKVADRAGNALTAAIEFTTPINGVTRERTFNTQSQPQGYIDFELDTNGYLAAHVTFNTDGDDDIWYTADDGVAAVARYTYSGAGRLQYEWFMNPGGDTKLHTPDDVIYYGMSYRYDAMNQLAERTYHGPGTAGADNMFGTPDDVITYLLVYTYTNRRPTGFIHYEKPGPNGTWRDSDDECYSLWDYIYDADGRRTREVYKFCGPDDRPGTSDDMIIEYRDYEYDANNALVRLSVRNHAGFDGDWFTPDDVYASVQKFSVNPNGLPLATQSGTSETNISSHTRILYNENRQPIEVIAFSGPGADTMWGTMDDVPSGTEVTTYDARGNRVEKRRYDLGPDGQLHSGDERMLVQTTYDTEH